MGTAIGMVITHIMEDGTGTMGGGIGRPDNGTVPLKCGTGIITVVGKVDIMEAGEDLEDIMVGGSEGIVDESYKNEKGLKWFSKRDVKRE